MVTENADFWSKIGIFGVRNFLRELIIEEVHNIPLEDIPEKKNPYG